MNGTNQQLIDCRTYGGSGQTVFLLHGGPGAPGYMAPVARALSDSFRVIEPLQRGSGDEPLSVAGHVRDMHDVVAKYFHGGGRPVIVGHSWGAMLALAFSAKYPDPVGALALVGCGTFERCARDRIEATRLERMGDETRQELVRLQSVEGSGDARLAAAGRVMQRIDSNDLVPGSDETLCCDARAYEESWRDMIRLQNEGVYPRAFTSIEGPAIMLHGDYDPHPGPMIHANLKAYIPKLEYQEWRHCGHYPWLEREVHHDFLAFLRSWIARHTTGYV